MQDKYRKRWERVIDALEKEQIGKEPLYFDMSTWTSQNYDHQGNVCGTAACIGGTAVLIRNKGDLSKAEDDMRPIDDYLGITPQQADKIFYGPTDATPKQAVKMLREFVETGVVPKRWANSPNRIMSANDE